MHPQYLDRCFHRAEGTNSDQYRYANVTPTDFKKDAPAECRMCLPFINCGAIDRHCYKQEIAERNAIIALGAGLALVMVAVVISSWFKNRRYKKILASSPTVPEVTLSRHDGTGSFDGTYELSDLAPHRHSRRTLVMQTAQQVADRAPSRGRRVNTI